MSVAPQQPPARRAPASLLATLFLMFGAGPLLAQAPRPPQPPPRWGDEAYIESLFQRYDTLTRTDAVVETERARAKVHYYLTFMELADQLPPLTESIENLRAEIERKRALGQEHAVRPLEANVERSVAYRDRLEALLAGSASPEQIRALGGNQAIKVNFYRLTPDDHGRLRPDGMRARRESQQAPLVVYSGLAARPQDSLAPQLDTGMIRWVTDLAESHSKQNPGLPAAELEKLVGLSREASQVLGLLESKEFDAAQEIIDRRWDWIMAWGDEQSVPVESSSEASTSSLPRPPGLPPHGDDPRYVADVISQYDALCKSELGSLEWMRAQARASWYHNWRKVHEEVERARIAIQGLEAEVTKLRGLGVNDQADSKQSELDRQKQRLAQFERALAGGPVDSLIRAQVLAVELPVLSDGRATGAVQPGFTPLGFYAESRISRDKPRAAQKLKYAQGAILAAYEAASPGPAKEELAEYSRELGHCLELLEANEVEELDRIFDERWSWILAWGDDSAFEQVDSKQLPDLLVPVPSAPVTRATIKSIKQGMKGQPLIERNRVDLQATFARGLQAAVANPHAGPLTFGHLRDALGGAWGVGWEDVRTGGDRTRVTANLERVEQQLSTWLTKTKKDSASSRSAAERLLDRVQQAQKQYADGEYSLVMDHLAAIRAWILEDSEFELH